MESIADVLKKSALFKDMEYEVLDTRVCERCKIEQNLTRFRNLKTRQLEENWSACGCEVLDHMEAEQERARKEKHERRIQRFMDNSIINPKLKNATFSNYITDIESLQQAARRVRDYVVNWEEGNLMLYGSYGTGKSHLAVSSFKKALAMEKSALFISVPKLYTKIRATWRKDAEMTEDQLMQMLNEVDLLVLDDIGAEAGEQKGWSEDKLFQILDSRQGKRTIYTTNLKQDALSDLIGNRNMSRLSDELEVLVMNGPDWRKKNKEEKKEQLW